MRELRRDVEKLRNAIDDLGRQQGEATQRLRHDVDGLQDTVRTVERRLDERSGLLLTGQKEVAARIRMLRRQAGSLVRAQYFKADLQAPHWLSSRRFHLRSQHEEDGIILALLEETGIGSRRFVEIGCGSSGGNSAVLAYDMGWGGVMIDIKVKAIERLREELRSNPAVTVLQARVTAEGISALLRAHGISGEVDLLSIDIDSIDYWILDALEPGIARVVVIEYNAHFGPTRAVTLPNAARPSDAPKIYFGASLAALEKLARRKGYRLVLCEDAGVNAFFVRDGLAPSIRGLSPEEAYRPQMRPVRKRKEPPMDPDAVFALIGDAGLPLIDV